MGLPCCHKTVAPIDETKKTVGEKAYRQYVHENVQYTELFRIQTLPIFLVGFIPPLCAAVLSIVIALVFHNDQISNYNWQCGRARFPSLSRIINLPLERGIWQILIFINFPIRVIELITGFIRYDRLYHEGYGRPKFFNFMRHAYFIVGLGELFFLGCLSIIGERENTEIHVICFYLFGFCGIGFFIASTFCHRHSLYYVEPYGKLSYRLKLLFMGCYIAAMPILVTAFILYWKQCLLIGYEIFALCEYIGVLFNIAYHGTTYFDVKDRMLLSVRIAEPIELPNSPTVQTFVEEC
uniref:Frag1/DRAM/Sfk1 family-domain-containing protein n=1 Tax=Panagrellus redivivus TaxID=6233 RepID=A0A7E4ZWH2_PANRE